MGKRTRSTLAYIATRLDIAILELQRLNARLDAVAGPPDDTDSDKISQDTYTYASDLDIQQQELESLISHIRERQRNAPEYG